MDEGTGIFVPANNFTMHTRKAILPVYFSATGRTTATLYFWQAADSFLSAGHGFSKNARKPLPDGHCRKVQRVAGWVQRVAGKVQWVAGKVQQVAGKVQRIAARVHKPAILLQTTAMFLQQVSVRVQSLTIQPQHIAVRVLGINIRVQQAAMQVQTSSLQAQWMNIAVHRISLREQFIAIVLQSLESRFFRKTKDSSFSYAAFGMNCV